MAAPASWQFEALGTSWQIELFDRNAPLADIQAAVASLLEAYDKTYSRFRSDSLIHRIAQRAGRYQLPVDATALFDLYDALYEATDGAVTPLIGTVLEAAGYDASYSLTPGHLEQPGSWPAVVQRAGSTIVTQQPVTIDVGAAGKGYAADLVAACLRQSGVQQFSIDASGDFVIDSPAALTIALEHPVDAALAIGEATITQGSLCGSAGNRRRWAGFHHIIDPRSLTSPQHIAAVWVYAETGLLADGLATALFFVPPARLKRFSFDYLIVSSDNKAELSAHFPGRLYEE